MGDDRDQDEPRRVDLSALDPGASAARFDRLVGGVMAASAAEMARRSAAPSIWDFITRWRRPVFATSAALALGAVSVFLLVKPVTKSPLTTTPLTTTQLTLAEAAGVPSEWVRWTQTNLNPSPAELLAMGQETQ